MPPVPELDVRTYSIMPPVDEANHPRQNAGEIVTNAAEMKAKLKARIEAMSPKELSECWDRLLALSSRCAASSCDRPDEASCPACPHFIPEDERK
ncbi:MAG: hypothetical protein WC505_06330 [Patescibacteria group bacterium]